MMNKNKNFENLCPPGTKVIYYPITITESPKVYKVKNKPRILGRIEIVKLDNGCFSTSVLVSKTGWKGNQVNREIDLSLIDEDETQLDWLE
jgi:hypothetical protein